MATVKSEKALLVDIVNALSGGVEVISSGTDIIASNAVTTLPSIPTDATGARVTINGADVVYSFGTTPIGDGSSPYVGHVAKDGEMITINSASDLADFKWQRGPDSGIVTFYYEYTK